MSVILHVDFSNGVTKTYTQVPLKGDNSVTSVLDAASFLEPRLSYEFDEKFVDRADREVGVVTSIDGVAAGEGKHWSVWVNARAVSELRRVTESSMTDSSMNTLKDGDIIMFKLTQTD